MQLPKLIAVIAFLVTLGAALPTPAMTETGLAGLFQSYQWSQVCSQLTMLAVIARRDAAGSILLSFSHLNQN